MKRQVTCAGLALILLSAAGYTQDSQEADRLIGSWKLVKAVYAGKSLNPKGQVEIKNVTDSAESARAEAQFRIYEKRAAVNGLSREELPTRFNWLLG